MISEILQLLASLDYYGQSEVIEIAKGKNEIPKTFKKAFTQIKRELKFKTI